MDCQRCALLAGLLWIIAAWSGSAGAGWLGLAVRPPSGVEVEEVATGSPAAQAGILPGDQILAVNGLVIHSVAQLTGMIGNLPHKMGVVMQILRNGETLEVKALTSQPPLYPTLAPTRPSANPVWLGITVVAEPTGLTIKEVSLDSPAHRAGLRRGDVLVQVHGHNISSPEMLNDLVSKQYPGTPVALNIVRDGIPLSMRVDLMVRPSGR